MAEPESIPPYDQFMWPCFEALKALGGFATVQEKYEWVVEHRGFTEEQQAILRNDAS